MLCRAGVRADAHGAAAGVPLHRAPIWRRPVAPSAPAPRAPEGTSVRLPAACCSAAFPHTAHILHLRSMAEVQAQLDQMSDRARERAVSIAEAVRAAGEGDADLMTRLQHQQDDQLQVGGVPDAAGVSCWPVRAAPNSGSADGLLALAGGMAVPQRSFGAAEQANKDSASQQLLSKPTTAGQADKPSCLLRPSLSPGGREHVGAHPGHLHPGAQLGVQTGIENLEALQASKPLKATARCHLLPAPLVPSPCSLQCNASVQLQQCKRRTKCLQVMSKGYIQSSEKIRDRLMVGEWELSRKAVAMRR